MCKRYDVMDHAFMNNLSELNALINKSSHLNINDECIFSGRTLLALGLISGELLGCMPTGQEDNMHGCCPLAQETDHYGEHHRLAERVK